MTIGRAPGSTLQLDDPAVSRRQARISDRRRAWCCSRTPARRYGTWLDGHRVERSAGRCATARGSGSATRSWSSSAGATRPRRAGPSSCPRGVALVVAGRPARFGTHPRVRSGYALKRLEASEGPRRWVLRDLGVEPLPADVGRRRRAVRAGRRPALAGRARPRGRAAIGAAGPARLARLLSELAERGLLAGVDGAEAAAARRPGSCSGSAAPREKTWTGAGRLFERLYRRGGWRLFTRPGAGGDRRCSMAVGLVVFPYLVVGALRDAVRRRAEGRHRRRWCSCSAASRVVAAHETAHGLTMASLRPAGAQGRPEAAADLPLRLRGHVRGVVRAPAPADRDQRGRARSPTSSLGALFALACLALPAGTLRDILFQLAFAAYVGAFFNLNPFVERDGYQILVDLLREPGLRRRAREQLVPAAQRAAGQPATRRVLARYALFGLAWSARGGLLRGRDVAALRAAAGAGGARSRSCGRAWPRSGWRSSCRCSRCWAGRCASGGAAGRPDVTGPRPTPPPACSSAC